LQEWKAKRWFQFKRNFAASAAKKEDADMKKNKPNETALDTIEEGRREFVKKLVAGSAFAAPLLASFSMDGALIGEAEAREAEAPYCGIMNVSYKYAALARFDPYRINANLVADVFDGATVSVVLNFTPKSDFHHAALIVNGNSIAVLQLGPNVISTNPVIARVYGGRGNAALCAFLDDLHAGLGYIRVTMTDNNVLPDILLTESCY